MKEEEYNKEMKRIGEEVQKLNHQLHNGGGVNLTKRIEILEKEMRELAKKENKPVFKMMMVWFNEEKVLYISQLDGICRGKRGNKSYLDYFEFALPELHKQGICGLELPKDATICFNTWQEPGFATSFFIESKSLKSEFAVRVAYNNGDTRLMKSSKEISLADICRAQRNKGE